MLAGIRPRCLPKGRHILTFRHFDHECFGIAFRSVVFTQLRPQLSGLDATIGSIRGSKDLPRSNTSTPTEYSFKGAVLPSIACLQDAAETG